MMEARPKRIAAFAMQGLAGCKQPVSLLARFARHVYLLVGEGDARTMLILSPPSECMTPFTVTLAFWPPPVEEGCPMWCDGQVLHMGRIGIRLAGAPIWLSSVPTSLEKWKNINSYKVLLEDIKKQSFNSDYLTAVVENPTKLDMPGWDGTELARGLIEQDRSRIFAGVSGCVGLGRGLTPAGDDFLCGAMLAAHQFVPKPAEVCKNIMDAAVGKTTTLSSAFIISAAQGHVSEDWRKLLVDYRPDQDMDVRLRLLGAVVSHGYSSGADSLAGFLWAAHVLARTVGGNLP